MQGKEALQLFQPIRTAAGDFPGVKAQGGLYQVRVTTSQCHHVGPVVLTGAVDDAVPDPGIPDRWEKFGQSMQKPFVLEVIVRVEKRRHEEKAASDALSWRAAS